ncbi:MAG: HAD hydrolase-like protein [Deltaproteobacteria bacterium]|nr:HAD hydrolase-like protein [Deltaproteobacteria bacterium]
MEKKAFAFDLDGTVVDSRSDIVSCVNRTLRYYNLSELPFDKIVSYVGNGARVLMERVLGDNLSQINLDEAVKKFREIYLEHCVDESSIFDDITECFEEIKKRGHYLFVITNKPSPHSEKILKHFGLFSRLDGLYCQDTMKALKPDPVTIYEILKLYPVKPQDFYMIGDSKVDMDFARSGGIRSIMVGYGGVISEEEFISASADYKSKTTSDLKRLILSLI